MVKQMDFFGEPPPPAEAKIDGATFDPKLDGARLDSQLERVRAVMRDGLWRTLAEIQRAIGGGSEAAISARLRDFRKIRHGAWKVDRRRRGDPSRGLHEYRVEPPPKEGT